MQHRLEAWIETDLQLKLLEPLKCLQESDASSWFEGRTKASNLFVKVSPQTALLEGRVGQVLSSLAPGFTPDILGVNVKLGAIITRKLEAENLSLELDTNIWLEAVNRLAQLQRSSLVWVAELRLQTLDLPMLLESCNELIGNVQELEFLGLMPEQITKIQTLPAKIAVALEIFQASGLPNTLIHGDFHANNVLVERGIPILIDWSEVALGSPLLDLGRFLEFLRRSNMNTHPARDIENALTEAFYELWQDQISRESFFAAARVAPLIATLVFAARAWQRETQKAPFMVAYHLKRAVKMIELTPNQAPSPD